MAPAGYFLQTRISKEEAYVLLFILHDLQKTLGHHGTRHTRGLGHEEGTWGSKSTESWAEAECHPPTQGHGITPWHQAAVAGLLEGHMRGGTQDL